MFNFPWSNFHELNLDWILSVVKEAKEIFIKGEGDIQHAVETADQALETAEQAAAGVIADGAVTIPKLNSEVYSLFAYCVSGSVAPNFIPAGALVIVRKSTIANVADGIYIATRDIPQATIITAADLDQSATLAREGGMNYLLHNEEKLSGTIDLIKAGLVFLVNGDEASATVPADGLVYVANNTHGLTEGFYFNSSGAAFPTTGGTADSDSFTAVNNILNALQTAIATLGSDDIANDSTVTGASVTDALDEVKNTLDQLETETETVENGLAIIVEGDSCVSGASQGQYVYLKDSTITGYADGLYTAAQAIPANTVIDGTYLTAVTGGGLNSLNNGLNAIREYMPRILEVHSTPVDTNNHIYATTLTTDQYVVFGGFCPFDGNLHVRISNLENNGIYRFQLFDVVTGQVVSNNVDYYVYLIYCKRPN